MSSNQHPDFLEPESKTSGAAAPHNDALHSDTARSNAAHSDASHGAVGPQDDSGSASGNIAVSPAQTTGYPQAASAAELSEPIGVLPPPDNASTKERQDFIERLRHHPSSTMAKGTLSRLLMIRIGAMVALISIMLGGLTTILVRQILVSEVDREIAQSIGLETHGSPDSNNSVGLLGGLPANAVVALRDDNGNITGRIETVDRSQQTFTSASINAAIAAVPTDNRAHTVLLPGLGSYRLIASPVNMTRTNPDGSRQVISGTLSIAFPLDRSNDIIGRLIVLESLLSVVAIFSAVVISRAVIHSSLGPLNRLANTADAVSRMDLDKGEVNLPARIPPSEADPTNEVGRVGFSFNHMLDNVESALTSRENSENKVKQFVADASHELRNPLASIRGYAELAQRRSDSLDVDTAFAMSRISSESERMSGLVEDMLLLARLDTKPEMQLTEVDPVEIVLNAVSDAQVAGPDHKWTLNLPDEPITVMADANQLHQVIANLLSNARKHTPAGVQVDTSVQLGDGQAIIRVHDNGPGVPPQIRNVVFERFARADVARTHDKEGSTGLGLAIVQAVMTAHGGSASLESSADEGKSFTTFTLCLPLAASEEDSGHSNHVAR